MSDRSADASAGSGSADAKVSDSPSARTERPIDVVEPHTLGSVRLPGARRAGYTQLPTGPVGIERVVASGPEIDTPHGVEWVASTDTAPLDGTRLAPWALVAAIVALGASFFVGWGIPVAVIAVIAAIMSLRRPVESRAIARWALVLGLCATVYSLGWLVWAVMQFDMLG